MIAIISDDNIDIIGILEKNIPSRRYKRKAGNRNEVAENVWKTSVIVFAIYRHQCLLCALNSVLISQCQRVHQ